MKEIEPKRSAASWLAELAKGRYGEYALSVLTALLGVACSLIPYFIIIRLITALVNGTAELTYCLTLCAWMAGFWVLRYVLHSVFALNSSQHSAVEIRQHLVAVLQTVGFQKGRCFHLPHIFRCVSDDLIHHVLGGDSLRLVNILIAVGNTAALGHFAQRRTVKQDTQPVSVNFVQLETLLGKDDCCFSEVTDLFFCADAHIAPPMHKK